VSTLITEIPPIQRRRKDAVPETKIITLNFPKFEREFNLKLNLEIHFLPLSKYTISGFKKQRGK
jgi:hypothetical protein